MVKKLARSIREYMRAAIATPFCMVGEVSMECIIPFVMGELIDYIEGVGDTAGTLSLAKISIYGGILLVCAFLSLYFGILGGKYSAIASSGFARNLRHDMFERIQAFSFANIDKFSSSSLVTRLTTDVSNVQNSFMMVIRIAIRSPLMLVFSLVMAFIKGGSLAWTFAVVLPIIAAAFIFIMLKAMPIFTRIFKKYDNLNRSVQEDVKAMRVVKAYVREDYETEKFNRASNEVAQDFTRAEKIVALNNPVMRFSMNALMIIVSYFGAKLIMTSMGTKLTTGSLSSLITYSIQVLSSLMMFTMIFVMLSMSVASARRICEVLDEQSSIVSPSKAVTEVKDGSVKFDCVSFKYSIAAERYALEKLDFEIKAGETVGIFGGTGSGKSSLIQLISRLYDATEGTITVGGVDVRDYDLDVLRSQVAVVLQKNVLFSGTVKENLRWGNENATDEQIVEVCKLAQADEFVSAMPDKYDTFIEQGGSNVSGGQKQRLCIARALLKRPKILILDDSTSAVDTQTDALIRRAMASELPGTTKIIIAQRISSIQDADKIIVLDGGKIMDIGNHAELMERSKIYREVYASQNKLGGEN